MILTRTIGLALAVFLACDSLAQAEAQEARCLPRADALHVLQTQLEQDPLLHGWHERGPLIELFWSEVSGDWTVVVTGPAPEGGLQTCRALGGFKLQPGAFESGPGQ